MWILLTDFAFAYNIIYSILKIHDGCSNSIGNIKPSSVEMISILRPHVASQYS